MLRTKPLETTAGLMGTGTPAPSRHPALGRIRHSGFVIRHSFVIRISSFVITGGDG